MCYSRDVPTINGFAHASPANLGDVCIFVLLSIREPFQRMRSHMRDVRQYGARSNTLWGFKRTGFEYVRANQDRLFDELRAMETGDVATAATVTHLFTQIPGLGMVKAAFVAQMLGYNVACFDSRNMARLGFAATDRPWRSDGKRPSLARVQRYVQATAERGAEYWWDVWCNEQTARLGYDTSRAHREIICGALA